MSRCICIMRQATVVIETCNPKEVQGDKGIIKDLHNDVVEECRKHGVEMVCRGKCTRATQGVLVGSRFLHGTPRAW